MSKPTVFIVEDEQAVTDSLSWLLESLDYQVQAFTNAESFLNTYNTQLRGCLVLDVRMPKMSGLELQETLIERHITLPIIFTTGHGDIEMAVRAVKRGALEFLTKPVNNQRLLDAINKGFKLDESLSKAEEEKAQLNARLENLTAREHEVMLLMVEGKSTKVMAKELEISPNTVELHRAKVMKKVGVGNHAELVALILKQPSVIS